MILLTREQLVDERLAWPVLDARVLARGRIGTFVEDQVATPDGDTLGREYLHHPGAVGIIALDESERVALVRQYRHPVRHRLIEPPAGLLDVKGEDPLLTAQRELAEEVGLAAREWHVLVDLCTSPGILAERLRIYLARGLSEVDAPEGFVLRGEEAHMDAGWAALDDLVDAVLGGDLHNPTMVSGVLATAAARGRNYAGLRPGDAAWPARGRG